MLLTYTAYIQALNSDSPAELQNWLKHELPVAVGNLHAAMVTCLVLGHCKIT